MSYSVTLDKTFLNTVTHTHIRAHKPNSKHIHICWCNIEREETEMKLLIHVLKLMYHLILQRG